MPIRPLLSATIDPLLDSNIFTKIRFPVITSPKLDGIRAIAWNSILQSRNGRPIPSLQAQSMFSHLHGLDGELIIGHPTDINVYNTTQSYVMSVNKPGDMHFWIFDRITDEPFYKRLESLPVGDDWLIPVPHTFINNLEELLEYESSVLSEGYEGIMLRNPIGKYKHGRSTFNEQILMKLKRFSEFEAPVVGLYEQMINTNEAKTDNLGYTERSSNRDKMVPAGTLGKFLVDYNNELLEVSCGCLTHAERKYIWENPRLFLYEYAVIRHFQVGLSGYRPRFPRFVGWRKDGR